MSFLSIKDAPLKTTIVGDEKIPTGGYGDLAITTQQIKDFTALSFSNVDNTSDLDKPVSNATQAALNLKANITYVDNALALKSDKTYVDDQLALKASKIYVDTEIQKTASKTYVDNQLATKASTTYVDSINSQKANLSYVDDELALKSDITYVDSALANKTHNSLVGRDVAGAHPASAILDASGRTQQEINDGVPSVAAMRLIPTPRNGSRVSTVSYHEGLGKGGATYIFDSSKADIDNGVSIIKGWVLQFDGRICVTQAGCKLDGVTDDAPAFNACAALNIPMRIGVSGTLKALSPINLNTGGLIGSGIFSVIDVVGGHDGIILPLGGGRLFQNIEKFRMISSDNSAIDHIAIRSKQITNPASESLGNGFKIRDIEIGGGGRFGIGIALTDCFRASINDVGMTSCGNAIVLYGRVVQCKVGVVTSNSDEFGNDTYTTTALTKLGNISTKIDAAKRYGLLVVGSNHTGTYQYPESIKSRDNSYVKHHYGLYHYDGLFCTYKDIDLDYNFLHGAYFYSCNGLVTLDTAWVAQNAGASHGIVIDTSVTTPKKLILKNIHGFSYGELQADSSVIYQSSDGVSKPFRRGVVIEGVTLASNFWTYGININRMRNFTIKNYVEEGTPITRGLNIYNSRDFQITDCICALATIYAPTNEFNVARITGTVTYTLADSATGERINPTSFGIQNKPLQMIGLGGAWKAPVKFGGGFLWIASDGKLMKKVGSVAPESDTDGVEIT